jgi:DNA-binding NtrC family response regulator
MDQPEGNLLIVDDNKSVLDSLRLFLKHRFGKVITLESPKQIINTIKKEDIDLVLLDMNFTAGDASGKEGLYYLSAILDLDPAISVVFITAYGGIELAVEAIHKGAIDFILKPWDNQKLLSTLQAALRLRQSKLNVKQLNQQKQALSGDIDRQFELVRGTSPAMAKVYETVEKVAKTLVNVLITGENGTGKELIAREIHRQSGRAGQIFLSVDLSSLSGSLFESELFGHTKGSFTDAKTDRTGKFLAADKGTLFLDEIGNLPTGLQSKLLTSIQNREIIPVGSNTGMPVDVRIICATNKDLQELLRQQQFREDLYYRINTIIIDVPPLREREGDIMILAGHFLKKFSDKYGKPGLSFSEPAVVAINNHPWPGNVRELKHSVEKAVILSDTPAIQPQDLLVREPEVSVLDVNKPMSLEEYETEIIREVLKKYSGNISHTARELNIGRQTLYRKIQKYGL